MVLSVTTALPEGSGGDPTGGQRSDGDANNASRPHNRGNGPLVKAESVSCG